MANKVQGREPIPDPPRHAAAARGDRADGVRGTRLTTIAEPCLAGVRITDSVFRPMSSSSLPEHGTTPRRPAGWSGTATPTS